jgi:hypothetical protein
MRPVCFNPSPPGTIAELNFCIHVYQAVCKACIASGDGLARLTVESSIDEQKLRHDGTPYGFAYAGGGLSPALCEYNEQAATVRTPARKKTSTRPIRFAQLAEPVLPLLGARGCVLDAHLGDGHLGHIDEGVHPDFASDRRHGHGRRQVAERPPTIRTGRRDLNRSVSFSASEFSHPGRRVARIGPTHRPAFGGSPARSFLD